jgi:DNA uptake protein ComE-like DNA-binding protein
MSRITSLVLPKTLLRSERTVDGASGATGGTAMQPFLQETGTPVSNFHRVATEDLRFDHRMAENKHVRMLVPFGVLALALSCALTPGLAGHAYQSPAPQGDSRTIPAPDERVDINAATLDQLMNVPGMTRTWGERIIRYRPYRGKNELVDRGIVTSQVYDRIKDYIIAHRAKT